MWTNTYNTHIAYTAEKFTGGKKSGEFRPQTQINQGIIGNLMRLNNIEQKPEPEIVVGRA